MGCKSKCCKCKKSFQGLFKGILTFPTGTEALTVNFEKNGTVTSTSRLEFPRFVGAPTKEDLEISGVGRWRRKCNGDIESWGMQYRQAGAGGGLPSLFGLTNVQIPSLPNYSILLAVTYSVHNHGKTLIATKENAHLGFADANYTVQNGMPVYPFVFSGYPASAELHLQDYDDVFAAIPK